MWQVHFNQPFTVRDLLDVRDAVKLQWEVLEVFQFLYSFDVANVLKGKAELLESSRVFDWDNLAQRLLFAFMISLIIKL